MADRPSAMLNGITFLLSAWNSGDPQFAPISATGSIVMLRTRRYFNTKQVTPFFTSQRATSNPSLSIDKARKAPPGQITTEVPFALPGSGLNIVKVGLLTLYTARVFHPFWLFSASDQSHPSDPAGVPSYKGMTLSCAISDRFRNISIRKDSRRIFIELITNEMNCERMIECTSILFSLNL